MVSTRLRDPQRCAHCGQWTYDVTTTPEKEPKQHPCCIQCQYVMHPALSARQKAVDYE